MTNFSIILLHGFASSPQSSTKIKNFTNYFRGIKGNISLRAPDLNVPSFENLLFSTMVERIAEEVRSCPAGPVFIIGSSLGALAALHFVDSCVERDRVEKMVLMAPPVEFPMISDERFRPERIKEWRESGWLSVFHYAYGETLEIHYRFWEDVLRYQARGMSLDIPTLIFHGYEDQSVNYQQVALFSTRFDNVELRLIHSSHRFTDYIELLWLAVIDFLELWEDLEISIRVFDMGDPIDIQHFAFIQETVLDILEAAYGSKSIGRQNHTHRIYNEKHSVFVAFASVGTIKKPIGVYYIRPDGKASGLAVSQFFKGGKIAKKLIVESQQRFPVQFVEISIDEEKIRHLLVGCGFQVVQSKDYIKGYLKQILSDQIQTFEFLNGDLTYLRYSHLYPNILHHFVMYEYNQNRMS